ncbi:hypothetical protein EMIHUDRAFT_198672 [Emiliania huxleyi CCMP1516]|uniref:Uncharacterized protein n=2 Tax=Emiliania huxleyi TaxID=2903 RepID=A0A0D3I7P1_EMIH1|nr:hypothetical protein EMIHUDRAFT_198672 [Emiliania huxleyi CCMP1516]EOD07276.1 hypothetical protein EMIHUDRAFT_198672 [Emiliania huxleyi CCMP1516]|eukprot:XP_005759705.1 hypothetical protein EMIHUDRAFT_198672 [Emiliania huxleyi CCMP1516]
MVLFLGLAAVLAMAATDIAARSSDISAVLSLFARTADAPRASDGREAVRVPQGFAVESDEPGLEANLTADAEEPEASSLPHGPILSTVPLDGSVCYKKAPKEALEPSLSLDYDFESRCALAM